MIPARGRHTNGAWETKNMNEVNHMATLTTKELTALEEQLGAEQVLIKKYRTMASSSNDTAIKTRYESIASRHQQHYDTLVNYLK